MICPFIQTLDPSCLELMKKYSFPMTRDQAETGFEKLATASENRSFPNT